MRKKVVAVFILLVVYLSMSYAESFWDGGVNIIVNYAWEKQDLSPNWVSFCEERLRYSFYTMGAFADVPVKKLSNDDVRLINKALQRYEVEKDEIYTVVITHGSSVKAFCVLITSIKGDSYWWEWVGRSGVH